MTQKHEAFGDSKRKVYDFLKYALEIHDIDTDRHMHTGKTWHVTRDEHYEAKYEAGMEDCQFQMGLWVGENLAEKTALE